MGNRAVITGKGSHLGIYLHWNGGRDSVSAFLRYAELAGLPGLNSNGRGVVQLVTVINNFFGNDGLNVHIDTVDPDRLSDASPGDEGVYVVEGFEIVARIEKQGFEQTGHDLDDMLAGIDQAQPERDQLGGYLTAVERPTDTLNIGDQIWTRDSGAKDRRFVRRTVLGFGTDRIVNGCKFPGVPYVDRYEGGDNASNPNSYIRTETVRIAA